MLGPGGDAAAGAHSAPRSLTPAAGLKPGDHNYRAYVGKAEHYDLLSSLQFSLLSVVGLRDFHYLLDVGCGSLRGGRLPSFCRSPQRGKRHQ